MTTQGAAAEVVVVVHKSNSLSSISENELSSIFLGNKALWKNNERIDIGMLTTKSEDVEEFLREICHKSIKRYNAHWMKHVFSGSGTSPQQFRNSNAAMYFVDSNKNAIAVIDKSKVQGNVKIITVKKSQ